jgi:hypothetical protein
MKEQGVSLLTMVFSSISEPLTLSDGNIVSGQNKALKKLGQKKVKKEETAEGEKKGSRDSVYYVNYQKYRAGLTLNLANVSGQGTAAVFSFHSSARRIAALHRT